jgi:hypothetical protein
LLLVAGNAVHMFAIPIGRRAHSVGYLEAKSLRQLASRKTELTDLSAGEVSWSFRTNWAGRCLPGAIDHFDGLDTFEDLARDGRCVADYWF